MTQSIAINSQSQFRKTILVKFSNDNTALFLKRKHISDIEPARFQVQVLVAFNYIFNIFQLSLVGESLFMYWYLTINFITLTSTYLETWVAESWKWRSFKVWAYRIWLSNWGPGLWQDIVILRKRSSKKCMFSLLRPAGMIGCFSAQIQMMNWISKSWTGFRSGPVEIRLVSVSVWSD